MASKKKPFPRAWKKRNVLLAMALTALVLPVLVHSASADNAPPVSGAAFTTVNEAVDGAGHCANGNPNVNCNIYDGKEFVWLNGGPSTAYVGAGSYFFTVLAPGGQADPNDGTAKNLSDDYDSYQNRTFTVDAGGLISYSGLHDFANNKIRLLPYADTPNPGGVYIMALCSLDAGYPVTPARCKYDAFKIRESVDDPPVEPPTITKDGEGTYDDPYVWDITKSVTPQQVEQVGGNATFNYTVVVHHDDGTIANVRVFGTITVTNWNEIPIVIDEVTDVLSDGTVCTVVSGGPQVLAPGDTAFAYSCDLGSTLPSGPLDNTATVTWSGQTVGSGTLDPGSDDFTFSGIVPVGNFADECVDVSDIFAAGVPETIGDDVCVGDPNPTTINYSRTVPVPAYGCLTYDNTATFTTNDTGTTGSDSETVSVCGPVKTGALTIGFWQNKNGQGIITGQAKTGVCPSTGWLRQYAPYQDLSATATCAQVATYVTNVIKAANASGPTMNAMLKAQSLATALDVYFSDPALGGNKIGAPVPIGGVNIKLTKVNAPIGSSTFVNSSPAFGGAACLTVGQALSFAAGQSSVGGGSWYGQVKATQELAKNVFDAVNNQKVFAC